MRMRESDGTPMAFIDWPVAVAALESRAAADPPQSQRVPGRVLG
jgi:hypothetical protein